MTALYVTHHALERFCQRCLGIETPVENPKRQVLRKLLNRAIGESADRGVPKVWDHWPAAIEGDRIVTVLEPWARLKKRSRRLAA